MKIDLLIDRLTLQGVSRATADEVAAAIQAELERQAELYGLPAMADGGAVKLDLASFEVRPGASVREIAGRIARELITSWHRQAGGSLPVDLDRAKPAAEAPSGAGAEGAEGALDSKPPAS